MGATRLPSALNVPVPFQIRLIDEEDRCFSFDGTLTEGDFRFSEDNENDAGEGYTLRAEIDCPSDEAQIDCLTIDGDAWRDLESNDEIGAFLNAVFIDGDDPQEWLNELAGSLGLDEAGQVL